MATWTNITNAALEPGKPIRSVDGLALRDNPIAITEGASGAPKIQNAAMDDDTVDDRLLTGTATNVGRDWVLARTALTTAGSLGSYGMFSWTGITTAQNVGTTISGANLSYASIKDTGASVSVLSLGTPSGTWRLIGYIGSGASSDKNVSLFLRIA